MTDEARKLSKEELAELRRWTERSQAEADRERTPAFVEHRILAALDHIEAQDAELRAARGLLAEAKEVLPRYLFGHDSDLRNGSPECRCSTCERARALLAKLEETK